MYIFTTRSLGRSLSSIGSIVVDFCGRFTRNTTAKIRDKYRELLQSDAINVRE